MTSRATFLPQALNIVKAAAALALVAWPNPGLADNVADALDRLATDATTTREVALKDMGLRDPIVLSTVDARRELFLPVPVGVPISDAALQLDARYLRGEGGRTNLVLSLDGRPVSSRSFTQPDGDAGLSIPVDGSPRPSGFVRLGAVWSSLLADRACSSERASGNILEIAPTTRLLYRYDAASVRDLASAWTALPPQVTILVSGQTLARETYDAAWRIGVALERGGKRAVVKALPSPGDEVDLTGIVVPEALRSIPAFRNLADAGRRRIADPAEIGALWVLGAPAAQAQMAIADQELRARIGDALLALDRQVAAAAPDAGAALARWRSAAMTLADEALGSGAVSLLRLSGQPMIAVAPDAGAKAAGLLDDMWRRIAVSKSLVVRSAHEVSGGASSVALTRLGAATDFDVLERGDWTATFDLGALSSDGRVPARLELDVSAAPGATATAPVASVFLNDRLLGAKRLDANGQAERIAVGVPSYALKPRNVLRVSFQRQTGGDHCRETPQAYPVAILPTSRLLLDKASEADDFAGIMPRLSGAAAMIVSDAWLARAPETLATAIRIADAAGLSPTHASFATSSASAPVKPAGPFLAFDAPVEGAPAKIKVEGDRLVIGGRNSADLLDVAGLDGLGALSVAHAGNSPGLLYSTIGSRTAAFDAPFVLTGGDVAVLGPTGVLAQIDTRDPFGNRPAGDDRKTWLQEMWGRVAWSGPAAMAGLFLLVVLRARNVRRRRSGDPH